MPDVVNGVRAIRPFSELFRSEKPLHLGAGNIAIDMDTATRTEKAKAVVADEGLVSI